MPSSRHVRITRTAISPRFATSTFGSGIGRSVGSALMGWRGSSTGRAFAERRERRALSRAMKRAGIDAPVHYDEVADSTNTVALDMAARGQPEWTLVAAGHQIGGRGRLGREWIS